MQCKSRARIERSNGSFEIRFVHADLQGKRCTRAWQTRVNKFRRVCNATLKRTYRHCNRFNWTIPVSVNYYSWRAAIVPRSSIDRSISPIWWKIINRGGNSRDDRDRGKADRISHSIRVKLKNSMQLDDFNSPHRNERILLKFLQRN